jgi:hypothetical protein
MRKFVIAIAAAAATLVGGALMERADAMTLGSAGGLGAAIEDVAVTDQVHCRPGRWHHRFRPHDGCFRRGFVVGPRIVVGPRYRAYRGYRGHVGPRFYRGGRRW